MVQVRVVPRVEGGAQVGYASFAPGVGLLVTIAPTVGCCPLVGWVAWVVPPVGWWVGYSGPVAP